MQQFQCCRMLWFLGGIFSCHCHCSKSDRQNINQCQADSNRVCAVYLPYVFTIEQTYICLGHSEIRARMTCTCRKSRHCYPSTSQAVLFFPFICLKTNPCHLKTSYFPHEVVLEKKRGVECLGEWSHQQNHSVARSVWSDAISRMSVYAMRQLIVFGD